MNNVRKLILTILTVMCLGAMFFYWFGVDPRVDGMRGVLLLQYNPTTIIAFVLIVIGIWKKKTNLTLSIFGSVLLLVMEIYYFFAWHIENLTGRLNFDLSIRATLPGFFVALLLTATLMIVTIVCWIMERKSHQQS